MYTYIHNTCILSWYYTENTSMIWLTLMRSTSDRNLELTEMRASSGHSWNQSILVQLTMAGNLRALTLSVVPTGEKHSTTCTENNHTVVVCMLIYIHVFTQCAHSCICTYVPADIYTLSCLRTLSIKKDQQFSRVSCWPADLTSFLTPLIMVSNSSPTQSCTYNFSNLVTYKYNNMGT